MSWSSHSNLSPPSHPSYFPKLPVEITRRIIHHHLSLPSSLPNYPTSSSPINISWDQLSGQTGRKYLSTRSKEREEVKIRALTLLKVCKSWKSIVLKYLYAEPFISTSGTSLGLSNSEGGGLFGLTNSCLIGDKKWDDTRLHPHSIPGRFILSLDLSNLNDGYFGPHVTSISRAFEKLIDLMPNLQHLKLPCNIAQNILSLEHWREIPCRSKLKGLEGLQTSGIEDGREVEEERLIGLLNSLKGLEFVFIKGPGVLSLQQDIIIDEHGSTSTVPAIGLDNLHTLVLDGIHSGQLISSLIQSDLPNLRRLLITPYTSIPGDQTYSFVETHGHKLLSLTILHTRDWPTIHALPPSDILDLCPNLRHISFSIPSTTLQNNRSIVKSLMRPEHPLESINIPKWADTERTRSSPSPSPAITPAISTSHLPIDSHFSSLQLPNHLTPPPRGSNFLGTLLKNPPRGLKSVTVDGFTWVSPKLPRAAQEAGAGWEMRKWSSYLEEMGIDLLDGEGRKAPVMKVRRDSFDHQVGMTERGRKKSKALGVWMEKTENDEDGG